MGWWNQTLRKGTKESRSRVSRSEGGNMAEYVHDEHMNSKHSSSKHMSSQHRKSQSQHRSSQQKNSQHRSSKQSSSPSSHTSSSHPDSSRHDARSSRSSGATVLLQPPPPWITLLVLGPAFFGLADGCLRRTVQHEPPPPTRPPTPPLMERTTPFFSHKLECYEEERDTTRCLNGGTCFAIVINNGLREIGCSCMPDFRGLRCDQLIIDLDMLAVRQENIRTASIAAGVSACILIVFVVLLSIFVYLRYKRKESRSSSSSQQKQVLQSRCGGNELDAVVIRRPFLDTAPPPTAAPRTSLRDSWKKSSSRLRGYFAPANTDTVEREDMRNNNPAPDKENEVNWLLKKEAGAGGGGVRNGAGRDPPVTIPMEDRTRTSTQNL